MANHHIDHLIDWLPEQQKSITWLSLYTPSTEKQSTGAINAFNEPSGIGVTTYSKDLAQLLDGNRAYLVSKPKFYCDEAFLSSIH
jgi:hypothetical protein